MHTYLDSYGYSLILLFGPTRQYALPIGAAREHLHPGNKFNYLFQNHKCE